MIMEDLWRHFCGQIDCSEISNGTCGLQLVSVTNPSSCFNHVVIIFFDVVLLTLLLVNFVTCNISSNKAELSARHRYFTALQMWSAVVNGGLGLVYIGLVFWILVENMSDDRSVFAVHWWVLYLFQGVTWLLVGLIGSLRGECFQKAPLVVLAVFSFLSTGFSCIVALYAAIVHGEITSKVALDILTFVGASLLVSCANKIGCKDEANGEIRDGTSLYSRLYDEAKDSCEISSAAQVTSFAKAGVFSRLSFCWLNSFMKLGKQKTLEERDIPGLKGTDRAEFCYLQFLEQFNKKEDKISSQSSFLWAIVACNLREILISGLCAAVKIITLSAGPLLLNAFIKVAEGNEAFRYEGYLLAVTLFVTKFLESFSQRQWYFRTRLIGLRVRSLLTAAIYRKQLRLSNVARMMHSGGEIMNYVTVDAYRVGEFPFWFHQTWTTIFQLCIVLGILIHAVGLATIAALVVIVLTVICNTPLAKLQHKFQSKLMVAQDGRLKACSEALVNMKVLKLYAWETHFKNAIEQLRKVECKWLQAVQLRKAYCGFLYWSSPVLVSAATFGACYFLKVPLTASNVFTYIATLRLVQEPIRAIPDVIGVVIQAKVAFTRIVNFLEAPELHTDNVRMKSNIDSINHVVIVMKSANLSWENNSSKLALRNLNLNIQRGEKVAICGEVGSGKSTLLAAILGEVPVVDGTVAVCGSIAYVSQTAWIQTGTIRDNILFGSVMDELRYQETLRICSLVKDLALLPSGDMTEIGERGVNLSGGQKQRIQLARALYQDADIYLLDDPFSAVDAHTAASLFNEYIMEALSKKTVLLVTHQVDFLPGFQCCLLMSDGDILAAGPYHELLADSSEFLTLVHAHKETAGAGSVSEFSARSRRKYSGKEITGTVVEKQYKASEAGLLIKQEEREVGDSGLKPYLLYLNQSKGYLYFVVAVLCHFTFAAGQVSQNIWMALGIDNPHVSTKNLIVVYLIIGLCSTIFLLIRFLVIVTLGVKSSESLFTQLLNSLFRTPMSFYDSTPLGRILSRISVELSIVDLDVPFGFLFCLASTINTIFNLGVLAVITWQVLFVSIPMIYMAIRLQQYYFATANELMRINGITKSFVANHLSESVAGAMTIRAFKEEDRFFEKNFNLIDANASPFFHNFAANEWLVLRLETLSAFVLSSAALCIVLLPPGTFSSGFIGMALSYGLTLNMSLVFLIQNQCILANYIISAERINQYMHIPSEAPEVIEENRPPWSWPSVGKVEIHDLQIRYRPDAPLVLRGISCTFEGGDKIGIVGRTGSGKTTLVGALFRLVEPARGKIVVDGIDISTIGLHDLRSRFGIIPQDPTLFSGTVRFNLDPLGQHIDDEIWEVLGKCQLKEAVQGKEQGLNSIVVEDGSNWSMGQRQLFCLGRALLRRSRVLVLDEATASIDNATDMILQKTIRTEFTDCTVITVAHRIPTVMDCTKVLAISDGKLVEYEEPMKLMKKEGSLFGQLVQEYWSHIHSAESH